MSEKELINLRFKKQVDNIEKFYYYTLDITKYFTFITDINTEIKNDKWDVYIFDNYDIIIKDINDLKTLIAILNKCKNEKN